MVIILNTVKCKLYVFQNTSKDGAIKHFGKLGKNNLQLMLKSPRYASCQTSLFGSLLVPYQKKSIYLSTFFANSFPIYLNLQVQYSFEGKISTNPSLWPILFWIYPNCHFWNKGRAANQNNILQKLVEIFSVDGFSELS
jgi:hypothetical protein